MILPRLTPGRVPGAGLHQRAAIHQGMNDTSGSHPPRDEFQIDSQFIFYLLKDWAWGGLSASEVQRRAMHAYNEQLYRLKKLGVNPDWCMQSMLRMSRLGHGTGSKRGSSKIQKGNINRDLPKCLGDPSTPEPYIAQVPMLLSKPGTTQVRQGYVPFPIMLPHELLA